MKKRKSLFFALCLTVASLCLFISCGLWEEESGTGEKASSSVEEVLPEDSPNQDSPNQETPKEETSTNGGIQFPEVPLP